MLKTRREFEGAEIPEAGAFFDFPIVFLSFLVMGIFESCGLEARRECPVSMLARHRCKT